jgi:hypothetical protein
MAVFWESHCIGVLGIIVNNHARLSIAFYQRYDFKSFLLTDVVAGSSPSNSYRVTIKFLRGMWRFSHSCAGLLFGVTLTVMTVIEPVMHAPCSV